MMIVKRATSFLAVAALAATVAAPRNRQSRSSTAQTAPDAVVTQLWNMATRGDLLSPAMRGEATALFTAPPATNSKDVMVVSNDWGPPKVISITGSKARVAVGYWPVGEIDSLLRYTASEKGTQRKFGVVYTMGLIQTHGSIKGYSAAPGGGYKRDKALDKVIPGAPIWRIEAPEYPPLPFATVNAAIRYVLQEREKTNDPLVRKNAEKTLSELLRLN